MKELTIEARRENLDEVLHFVDEQLEAYGCRKKSQMQVDMAVEELYINIATYAYVPDVGYATLLVEVTPDPLSVIITFIDNGKPYDPLAKADPDITLSAEDRQIGGLGIYLVKKTMEDVTYEYRNGQNILTIRKNL